MVKTTPKPIVPIIAPNIPFCKIGCLLIVVSILFNASNGACKCGNTNSFILIFKSLNCSFVVSIMCVKSESTTPSAPKADALILLYSSKFCSIGFKKFKTCLSWNTSEILNISPPDASFIISTTSSIGSKPCSAESIKTCFRLTPNTSSKFLTANGDVTF